MSDLIRQGLYHALLWLIALAFFAPVAWIALASFKTGSEILAVPPLFVFRPTLDNYARLFAQPAWPWSSPSRCRSSPPSRSRASGRASPAS